MNDDIVARIAFPKYKTLAGSSYMSSGCSSSSSWSDEQRHEAQEIIPGLWIGPLSILRDKDLVLQNNIRVLISLTDTQIVPAIVKYKYQLSTDYECHTFDPGNKVTNPLAIVSQLADICLVIKRAQDRGVATLMFCEFGNEASAMVAASFLIYENGLDVISAVQSVQQKRFSVVIDDAAFHNLQTFQDLCAAYRSAAYAHAASPTTSMPYEHVHVKVSREREEEDESDLALTGILGTEKRQSR